jgi:hypothetical protein
VIDNPADAADVAAMGGQDSALTGPRHDETPSHPSENAADGTAASIVHTQCRIRC